MKKWKPKNRERYWWIRAIFPHMSSCKASVSVLTDIWLGDDGDLACFRYGNVFKTKKQAMTAGKEMLNTLKTLPNSHAENVRTKEAAK